MLRRRCRHTAASSARLHVSAAPLPQARLRSRPPAHPRCSVPTRDARRTLCHHGQARIRGNFTREVTDYELVEFRAAAQLQVRAHHPMI